MPAVYGQERAEGSFRYDHAWLRTHSESVVFSGVEAVEGRERERLNESFDAVVAARCGTALDRWPLFYERSLKYFGGLGGGRKTVLRCTWCNSINSVMWRGCFTEVRCS